MNHDVELGDFGLCNPWPEGFAAQLDRFRQGHILEGVPVFFQESPDFPVWSRQRESFNHAPPPVFVGEYGHPLRHAMVLTQACDLMRPKNPWITVCPVYDASRRLNQGQHGQVKAGQIFHLVHVSAQWTRDSLWVADLRLEMPLEKSILSGKDPIEAFDDEAKYIDLAQRLGALRSRLAAPQLCLDLVVTPLFEAMHALPDAGARLNEHVRELRVSWNDPNQPTVVTVWVLADDEAESTAIDSEGWSALVLSLYQSATLGGITIVGPEITSMTEMCAADYIQSAPVHDTLSS